MSRCFTFPPPGYEKKLTTDEPDLLKKEKRKEKKHKKDKKEKEKKDGKVKREKDRTERKHKDKKDKHRDKKKDNEKGKTDEKRNNGQFEGQNGQTLHHSNEQNKEKINSANDNKSSTQISHQNGDFFKNGIKIGDTENFKFVQELDRRIRDEEKGSSSHQFVNKNEVQKTNGRQVVNGAPPFLENGNIKKMQEKESDEKRGEKRKNKDRDKESQRKVKDTENEKINEKSERKKGERDKNKHIKKSDSVANSNNNLSTFRMENSFQGVGNEGNLKKRKEMETNGVSFENEPRPNKMARPISNISPENGRKLDFSQNPSSSLLQNSFTGGNKVGQKVNGMITAAQPLSAATKKPPPVITNHVTSQLPPVPTTKPPPPPTTTAKNLVSRPKPPPAAVNKTVAPHAAVNKTASLPPAAVNKTAAPLTASLPPAAVNKTATPPPAAVNKTAAPTPPLPKKKPPHPDTKYLNQILSVPKLDQWCGFDDQEWLFNKAGPTSKKPKTEEVHDEVWSEAKHIESVDVCALPYVIPY